MTSVSYPFDGAPIKDAGRTAMTAREEQLQRECDHWHALANDRAIKIDGWRVQAETLRDEILTAHDYIAGLKASLRGKWLPIDSAPKDGTEILLFHSDSVGDKESGCFVGSYDSENKVWSHHSAFFLRDKHANIGGVHTQVWMPATHWQPLPPPLAADPGQS